MEILFEAGADSVVPPKVMERATHTGDRYRIEVPEAEVYAALEQLKNCEVRILSVTLLRASLEDYFLKLVTDQKSSTQTGKPAASEAGR
jgi:hypothetical protein